jgi:hypothetical protein
LFDLDDTEKFVKVLALEVPTRLPTSGANQAIGQGIPAGGDYGGVSSTVMMRDAKSEGRTA